MTPLEAKIQKLYSVTPPMHHNLLKDVFGHYDRRINALTQEILKAARAAEEKRQANDE